jgi:hypothetical protein
VYRNFTRLPGCWDYYWDYLPSIHRHAIMDRFTPSEIAYAKARGEEPGLDQIGFNFVESHITQAGGVRVLILADADRIAETYAKRGDDMYGLDIILKANEQFDILESTWGWADIVYRLEKNSPWPSASSPLVDGIVTAYLEKQDRLTNLLSRKGTRHERL